jgi:hypothetical protein
MFNALLKAIFLPKASRERLAARGRVEPRLGQRQGETRQGGPRRTAAARTGGRDKVLQNALTVYRQQRDVYDSLDEETRRQIEADAAKLFGDLGKRQR